MPQPGLDGRHRDKNGQISRKHGNTLVRTLRQIYGPSFAPRHQPHEKLEDILPTVDEPSLSQLVRDEEQGLLSGKIRNAS